MKKIIVDPSILDKIATKIIQEANEYQRAFKQLFEEVNLLGNSWQGKDNIAFTNQIKGFEDDFRQIFILCEQYSDFLKTSARAYRETQDELLNQAKRLIN